MSKIDSIRRRGGGGVPKKTTSSTLLYFFGLFVLDAETWKQHTSTLSKPGKIFFGENEIWPLCTYFKVLKKGPCEIRLSAGGKKVVFDCFGVYLSC